MSKINFDDKLYNILNGNEKLLQFFINNGFDQLKNEKMLQTMGKMVSLNMALKVRGINKEAFVEKLNIESSPFSTFDNFKSFKYTFKGNEDYKYIINSNTKYTNTKNGSEITLSKAPIELITNLVYKERYVKGISEKESKSYTKLAIIILGISEVVGVLYLKNVYFKDKKSNKRKR